MWQLQSAMTPTKYQSTLKNDEDILGPEMSTIQPGLNSLCF